MNISGMSTHLIECNIASGEEVNREINLSCFLTTLNICFLKKNQESYFPEEII